MSAVEQQQDHLEPDATPAVEPSLRDQVQARKRALTANVTEVFDVPGYTGILKARYRILNWPEIRKIRDRAELDAKGDDAVRELYVAAGQLVAACEEVIRADSDNSTGMKWGVALAHELGFPEATSPRQAIFAIFPRDTWVVTHWQQLVAWWADEGEGMDEQLVGESVPPASSS